MPSENGRILNNMIFDSALVRDFLCINLSRRIGEYQPDMRSFDAGRNNLSPDIKIVIIRLQLIS